MTAFEKTQKGIAAAIKKHPAGLVAVESGTGRLITTGRDLKSIVSKAKKSAPGIRYTVASGKGLRLLCSR